MTHFLPNLRVLIIGIAALAPTAAVAKYPPAGMNEAAVHEFASFAQFFFRKNRSNFIKHLKTKVNDPYFENYGAIKHQLISNDFYLSYYESKGLKQIFLTHLFIGSPKIKLPLDISIGCSREQLISKLGTPCSESKFEIRYDDGDPKLASDEIVFYFQNDSLKYIVWHPYVD